ncbi:hypothetical protein AB0L49_29260 [Streptomyces antimycoticus]|uniref:hypothetical protein n=1 Tax=Streptomyces antimycoticus TaxID=68175 RepID=UPI00341B34B2
MTYFGAKFQSRATAKAEFAKAIWSEQVEGYAALIEDAQSADHALVEVRMHLEAVVKYKNEHQNELIVRNAEAAMQEASSSIHEATIALKASHACAAKIMPKSWCWDLKHSTA